jgi:hypothetical protein
MPRRGQHLAVVAERDSAAQRARDSRLRRGASEELKGWVAANCNLVALGDRYRRAVDDCDFWLAHDEEDPRGGALLEARETALYLERTIARLVSGLDRAP